MVNSALSVGVIVSSSHRACRSEKQKEKGGDEEIWQISGAFNALHALGFAQGCARITPSQHSEIKEGGKEIETCNGGRVRHQAACACARSLKGCNNTQHAPISDIDVSWSGIKFYPTMNCCFIILAPHRSTTTLSHNTQRSAHPQCGLEVVVT